MPNFKYFLSPKKKNLWVFITYDGYSKSCLVIFVHIALLN